MKTSEDLNHDLLSVDQELNVELLEHRMGMLATELWSNLKYKLKSAALISVNVMIMVFRDVALCSQVYILYLKRGQITYFTFFRAVMSCTLVGGYQYFGGTLCLHFLP
jgi:hypothetical protein